MNGTSNMKSFCSTNLYTERRVIYKDQFKNDYKDNTVTKIGE